MRRIRGPLVTLLFVLLAVLHLDAAPFRFRFMLGCRGCVAIFPTDTAQTVIDANPAGTTFVFKTGTHRFNSINPRNGDRYNAEPGAKLSGARLLHDSTDATLGSFVVSGSFWYIGGQTQAPGARDNSDHCQSIANGYDADFLACSKREELFSDGARVLNVETVGELAAGKWFFDYTADRIYVGDNPSSHKLETSITTTAFNPTADNVTLNGLTIEMYASQVQYGAVNGDGTSGWLVTGCTIRLNHGGGVRTDDGMTLTGNLFEYNGEIGAVGVGTNVVFSYNTLRFNNDAHWDQGWEGGGTKFVSTVNLIVRGNYSHDNHGPGLWTDIDNIYVLYEDNTCDDNDRNGIYHEISNDAVIRNNTVRRNGFEFPDWAFGAGIGISASPNVEVYGNLVQDNADGILGLQQNRGSGAYGAHEIANLYIHDNTVRCATTCGWVAGLLQDVGDTTYFTGRNNRFAHNTYLLQGSTNYFSWYNGDGQSFSTWQAGSVSPAWTGQDATGTATVY